MNGKHLILDCYGISGDSVNDKDRIFSFLEKLVSQIGMEIFYGPIVKPCYDKWNEGISGFVMITTSHISIHIWPEKEYLSFDCYSCKDFSENIVIDKVRKEFQPEEILVQSIIREMNYTRKNDEFWLAK